MTVKNILLALLLTAFGLGASPKSRPARRQQHDQPR